MRDNTFAHRYCYNSVDINRVGRAALAMPPTRDTTKARFVMPGDPTPFPEVAQAKTCTKCGETKALAEYGRRGDGLSAVCKPCWAAKCREQARKNPEATSARHARFRERHPDRRRAHIHASIGKARATWVQRLTDRADEFWSLAAVTMSGCWRWTGKVGTTGYGLFPLGSIRVKAHRAAYTLAYDDPGELFVCHHCDNPLCVRPDHLFLGTNKDNIDDAVAKGRMHQGERTGGAILSPEVVATMRDQYADGMSFQAVADWHGVTYGCARGAIVGRTWGHIPGAVAPRKAHETQWMPKGRKKRAA